MKVHGFHTNLYHYKHSRRRQLDFKKIWLTSSIAQNLFLFGWKLTSYILQFYFNLSSKFNNVDMVPDCEKFLVKLINEEFIWSHQNVLTILVQCLHRREDKRLEHSRFLIDTKQLQHTWYVQFMDPLIRTPFFGILCAP